MLESLVHLCEREGLGPLDPVRARAFENLGYLIASREPPQAAWERLRAFVEHEMVPDMEG